MGYLLTPVQTGRHLRVQLKITAGRWAKPETVLRGPGCWSTSPWAHFRDEDTEARRGCHTPRAQSGWQRCWGHSLDHHPVVPFCMRPHPHQQGKQRATNSEALGPYGPFLGGPEFPTSAEKQENLSSL